MSRYPCRITTPLPLAFQWGNLAADGYTAIYKPGQVVDIPPGSLLETQVGTANFQRLSGGDVTDAGGWCDHSVISN